MSAGPVGRRPSGADDSRGLVPRATRSGPPSTISRFGSRSRAGRSAAARDQPILIGDAPPWTPARRWRAADGGPRRQRRAAEESPHFGEHGVGWEPDGRESELRSSHDTARRYGEGVAPEVPPGSDETAVSPEASPDRRDEEFPRPSRRARSRMLPEPEWGLLPRPGRHVRKLACRPPKKPLFLGGNPRHTWTADDLARSLADLVRPSVRSSTDKEPTHSAPGYPGATSLRSLRPPSRQRLAHRAGKAGPEPVPIRPRTPTYGSGADRG
jgi:hypothetical protein